MFQNANSQEQKMATDAQKGDSVLSGRVDLKGKRSAGDRELDSLLYKNGLYYQMPSTKIVCTSRSRQTHVSQRATVSAPSQSMTIFINSSSEFIDGKQCYLGFTINSSVAGSWGRGSAANVIRSITCTTASGVTVASVDEVGLYKRYNDYYKNRLPWIQSQRIQGYEPDLLNGITGYLAGASLAAAATASSSLNIMIPMRDLCGLFDADVLLPPSIIGGMRIDIAFHTGSVSETGAAATAAAVFTITEGRIITDNYQLSPEASNYLKIASAKIGLPVPFKSQSHTQTTGDASVNMSSSRAVARALHVFTVHRLAAQTAGGAADLVPTGSAAWAAASQFQYRLGNLSFPSQVCQKNSEAYQIAVDSWDNEKGRNCGVSFGNFVAANGDAVMAANLERGWMEAVPVSSGRLLALNASGLTPGVAAEFHMFLTYLNVAKAYINRVELLE